MKTRAIKFSVATSAEMCEAYEAYFCVRVGAQGKVWAPPSTRDLCNKTQEGKVEFLFVWKVEFWIVKVLDFFFNLNIFLLLFFLKAVLLKKVYIKCVWTIVHYSWEHIHISILVILCCFCAGWYRGESRAWNFAISRICKEPADHSSQCFSCTVVPSKRRAGKNAPAVIHPHIPSPTAPVSPCPQLPVSTPPAAVLRREQQIRRERCRGSRLQRCSCREKPLLPQTKRPQRLDQRTWSHKVQCWAFDVEPQAVKLVRWKCACRVSEKVSPVCFKLFHPSRWGLLLFKATGLARSPVSGASSATAHLGPQSVNRDNYSLDSVVFSLV